jgi:hypothetical protein
MLHEKQYVLSVSYTPTGEVYPKHSLLNRRRMVSDSIYVDKVELPQSIKERIALVKLRRGSYAENEQGMWIGRRHLIVYLTKDEYVELKELADANTREQSEEKGTGDIGETRA